MASASVMMNVYVLLCEENRYYIGKTTIDVEIRFEQHLIDKECVFTTKYKPLKIIETIQTTDSLDEDKITKKYMMKYGIDNVRGGSYTKIILEDWQIKSLNHEFTASEDLCYKCNKSGHFYKKCPTTYFNPVEYLKQFNNMDDLNNEITKIQTIHDIIMLLDYQITETNEALSDNIDSVLIKQKKLQELHTDLKRACENRETIQDSGKSLRKCNNIIQIIENNIQSAPLTNKEATTCKLITHLYFRYIFEHNDTVPKAKNTTDHFGNQSIQESIIRQQLKSAHERIDINIMLFQIKNFNLEKKAGLSKILLEYKSIDIVKNMLSTLYNKKFTLF